ATRIRSFAAIFVPGRLEPVPSLLWFLGAAVVVLPMLWQIVVVVARRQRPDTWGNNTWWSLIGLAQITALILSPSFYYHYPNFAAPIMCLLGGIAVAWIAHGCGKTRPWIIAAALCVTYGVLALGTVPLFRQTNLVTRSTLHRLIGERHHCVWVMSPAF